MRRKLAGWGAWGVVCFTLEKLRTRLLEPAFRPRPGELYRYNDAVDSRCRSLGVGRHVSDFVDDYARAAGFRVVCAKHHVHNQPVLALQKKRGCALTSLPRTRFAGWLRRPAMVLSTRALDGADDRDPRRASSPPRCQAVAPTRTVAAAGASSASGSTSGASSL